MLKKIAAALEFPPHFGANLDALYDCLTELKLQKGHQYALYLDELEHGPAGDAIHTVFADAREWWADAGVTRTPGVHVRRIHQRDRTVAIVPWNGTATALVASDLTLDATTVHWTVSGVPHSAPIAP